MARRLIVGPGWLRFAVVAEGRPLPTWQTKRPGPRASGTGPRQTPLLQVEALKYQLCGTRYDCEYESGHEYDYEYDGEYEHDYVREYEDAHDDDDGDDDDDDYDGTADDSGEDSDGDGAQTPQRTPVHLILILKHVAGHAYDEHNHYGCEAEW